MTHLQLAIVAVCVAAVVVAVFLYAMLKISAATADRRFVDLPDEGRDGDEGHGHETPRSP